MEIDMSRAGTFLQLIYSGIHRDKSGPSTNIASDNVMRTTSSKSKQQNSPFNTHCL